MPSTPAPEQMGSGADPSRSRRSLLLALAVAVLVGMALGRFVSAGSDAGTTPTRPAGLAASVAGNAGDLGERIRRLEAAVAEAPDDLGLLQSLGSTYVQRAAEVGDPAFYSLAQQSFDRADGVRADQPGTLLGRGALALALHEFEQAREIGERLRDLLPRSAGPLGVLVDAEVELGNYDVAAEHVQAMLDLEPGTAALSRASYLRELNGDLDGAVTAMRQAVTAAPAGTFDRGVVSALVGDLHWRRGDLDAARGAYDEALRSAPGLPAASVGLSRLTAAEGDPARAIGQLEQLVQRVPLPDALLLLSTLQRAAGDDAAAEGTDGVVRAIGALQRDVGQVVDLELAVFEADHGDPAEALVLARRAYEARPDNVFAAHALAWAQLRAGDPQAAVPLVEQFLRLGTSDALLRYHAAVVLDAVGDTGRARAELVRAVATTPWLALGDPAAVRDLAERLDVPLPPPAV